MKRSILLFFLVLLANNHIQSFIQQSSYELPARINDFIAHHNQIQDNDDSKIIITLLEQLFADYNLTPDELTLLLRHTHENSLLTLFESLACHVAKLIKKCSYGELYRILIDNNPTHHLHALRSLDPTILQSLISFLRAHFQELSNPHYIPITKNSKQYHAQLPTLTITPSPWYNKIGRVSFLPAREITNRHSSECIYNEPVGYHAISPNSRYIAIYKPDQLRIIIYERRPITDELLFLCSHTYSEPLPDGYDKFLDDVKDGPIKDIAFDHDNKKLFIASLEGIYLLDLATKEIKLCETVNSIGNLNYALQQQSLAPFVQQLWACSQGKYLIIGCASNEPLEDTGVNCLLIWDRTSKEFVHKLQFSQLEHNPDLLLKRYTLAINPSSDLIIVQAELFNMREKKQDYIVKAWDLKNNTIKNINYVTNDGTLALDEVNFVNDTTFVTRDINQKYRTWKQIYLVNNDLNFDQLLLICMLIKMNKAGTSFAKYRQNPHVDFDCPVHQLLPTLHPDTLDYLANKSFHAPKSYLSGCNIL